MKMVKVAFFDAKPYDRESFDQINQSTNIEITYFAERLSSQTALMAKGFDAVCAFVNDKLDETVIETLYASGIKMIALRAAGYNNVDFKAAFGKIHVARVPAYSPYAVAEHSVALMLALNRKIHKAYDRTRNGNFSLTGLMGFDMKGKTAGVIGTGKIGKVVIQILKGFGMKVLAFDHHRDEAFQKAEGFEYVDLDTLLRSSDIITLHCPLTKETHHLINADVLSRTKSGVMIINTGRGGLIETRALIDALKSGRVGAAGLDVYEEESEVFFEDFSNTTISDDVLARLLTFPNVIVTSHQAFFTREALRNIAETTLTNIRDFFTASQIPNEVCYRCSETGCPRKTTGNCF